MQIFNTTIKIQFFDFDKNYFLWKPFSGFDLASARNDFALLHLKDDFELSETIDTICLPKSSDTSNEFLDECFATGWGKDSNGEWIRCVCLSACPFVQMYECFFKQTQLRPRRKRYVASPANRLPILYWFYRRRLASEKLVQTVRNLKCHSPLRKT